MSDVAISCEELSKSFRIPRGNERTLRGRILHPLNRATYSVFDALVDVNFSVEIGEFFGIVGRNGSGKSTLLKILAGIYRIERGTVRVNGSLAPFIELGVGFNEDLSARDNVYVNGAIMGIGRRRLAELYPRIVEFAELESFMDMKLRNFSSGMLMRLAFSIAVQADADILLVDEVLAVGDERFQRKCQNVFRERRQRGQTVVFVSHDMSAIEAFCDRVLVLDAGRVAALGPSQAVVPVYHRLNRDAEDGARAASPPMKRPNAGHKRKSFLSLAWRNDREARLTTVHADAPLQLEVGIDLAPHLRAPRVRMLVLNEGGAVVGEVAIDVDAVEGPPDAPIDFDVVNCLTTGRYRLIAELHATLEADKSVLADAVDLEVDVVGASAVGSTRFQASCSRARMAT